MIRTETQLDQRPRIRSDLGLPAVCSLILHQGFLRRLVPSPRRLAAQVMLTNERTLYGLGALRVNAPLSVRMRSGLAALCAGLAGMFLGRRVAGGRMLGRG